MSEEEEVVSWIGGPSSPIKRSGELSEDQVASAVVSYLKNGNGLLSDARLLIANSRTERGTALSVLALEELAKIKIIIETFLRFSHGVEPEAWRKYWKSGGSHKAKQEQILAYGKIIRASYDGDPIHGRYLYRHYTPDEALEKLDWLKQSSLYVDIRDDGVHAPKASENSIKATDYFLTFAQERADSYMSWHVSVRRTLDQLQVALGKRDMKRWTNSYQPAEVYSDLLYQASALSASHVPDYMTFNSFIKSYLRRKVSEKRVRQGILDLAEELRLRLRESERLPIFRARYFGAYKLVIGISENSELFSASFRRELRSKLAIKYS